jgi:VWFA-related protein
VCEPLKRSGRRYQLLEIAMIYGATSCLVSTVSIWIFSLVLSSAFGQTHDPSQEKQRIKDFGLSLKRLKWDDKKKAAVEKRSKSKPKRNGDSDEEEVVRVETTLVVCDILVLDSQGHFVPGLNKEDIIVTEDGQEQQVGTLSVGGSPAIPRSIVLVIDYSINQSGFVTESVEAAKILVDGLGPGDRMAIVTDQVELLTDFTDDKKKLTEKLDSLKARPALAINSRRSGSIIMWNQTGAHYSALLATLKEILDDRDQRPIIIFQANGNEASILQNSILPHPPLPPDNLSPGEMKKANEYYKRLKRHEELFSGLREFSLDDVYKAAEKSRATIYTIIPGYRLFGLSPEQQLKRGRAWDMKYTSGWLEAARGTRFARHINREPTPDWVLSWEVDCEYREQSALAFLAGVTGGWADFLEEPEQAAKVYSRILSDVNRRYVVGYYPSNKLHDGKRRTIKIEVRGHLEYTVHGRSSYYARGPEESLSSN